MEQVKDDYSDILWADIGNNIGLVVKALERMDLPVIIPSLRSRHDEDPVVGYTLVFEGMPVQLCRGFVLLIFSALAIKTTKLLIKLEQSIEAEDKQAGKAIVIGSIWDT